MNNEQTMLDMRTKLEREVSRLTLDAVLSTREYMTGDNAPAFVRNRHEAYGHAAEQLAHIQLAVKQIGKDTAELLATLSDPDRPALDTVASICNSTMEAAVKTITAAAEMDRIRDELYTAEALGAGKEPDPFDGWTVEQAESAVDTEAEEAEALADENEAVREMFEDETEDE